MSDRMSEFSLLRFTSLSLGVSSMRSHSQYLIGIQESKLVLKLLYVASFRSIQAQES